MEGSICIFSFPIMRKNCQIESDVCVCCKRDSKPLHWLSTHEQKKKKAKKKLTLYELGFSKGKQEQSSFEFFVHHFIKQTDIFFCCLRKLFVRGCTFLVTTTYMQPQLMKILVMHCTFMNTAQENLMKQGNVTNTGLVTNSGI